MHCHLASCVFQKLQDKNDGSGDELQRKKKKMPKNLHLTKNMQQQQWEQ